MQAGAGSPRTSMTLLLVTRKAEPRLTTDVMSQADRFPGSHLTCETNFVEAVVERLLQSGDLDNRPTEEGDHRHGEISMRYRTAAFAPGALDVDMDPEMVAGSMRELVNPRLFDRDPVGYSHFPANQGFQIQDVDQPWHWVPPSSSSADTRLPINAGDALRTCISQ
jgi:hypothetical protein